MGVVVNAARAVELLEQCVEQRGANYIYPEWDLDCQNWCHARDEPGCIVGLVFHNLGFPVRELCDTPAENGATATAMIARLEDEGLTGPGKDVERFTARAAHVLRYAQMVQDGGAPWGETIDKTKQALADDHYLNMGDE